MSCAFRPFSSFFFFCVLFEVWPNSAVMPVSLRDPASRCRFLVLAHVVLIGWVLSLVFRTLVQ